MSFLRRIFGGGGDDAGPPPPSGAPDEPVAVGDPEQMLSEQVGRLLERPDLEFLIVEWDAGRGLYLRFTPTEGGGLIGESVGDRYLQPRHRLAEAQRAALVGLGWHEAPASGNWERTWPAGTEPAVVARVCTETMGVYGVQPRPQWTITFGAD